MSYVSLDTTESRSHLEYMEKQMAEKCQQTEITMPIISKDTLKTGDKYRVTDSIMTHLIGKVVTIKNFKYISKGVKYYDVTIDDMDNCPLVCSDRVLEKI